MCGVQVFRFIAFEAHFFISSDGAFAEMVHPNYSSRNRIHCHGFYPEYLPVPLRIAKHRCFVLQVRRDWPGPYYAERSDTWRSNFLFKSFPRSTSAANQDKSREWNVSKQKWNMCHLKYQLDIWRKNTRSCQVGPRQVLRTTMNIHFLKI